MVKTGQLRREAGIDGSVGCARGFQCAPRVVITSRCRKSFDSGDVEGLAARLEVLLALSPADRAVLSAAARRAAEARWSWASVAQRLLAPLHVV